jgi:hypothetical protein
LDWEEDFNVDMLSTGKENGKGKVTRNEKSSR